ncbi:MAG: hypothetical protein JRH20_19235, partial [Deltaproteobacteria bacterium]|nr:hypothetical protein [Deltaproteobacteria bacterium]
MPAEGWTVLDLRDLREQGESLAAARGPVSARPGRDLLFHGTMEDYDIDDDTMDVAHWDVSGDTRFACRT